VTRKERQLFETGYFRVLRENEKYIEVQSINTKHCWIVQRKACLDQAPVCLYHKHSPSQKYYHKQCDNASVTSAVRKIMRHDEYVVSYVKQS
jgi:hypothetical protein